MQAHGAARGGVGTPRARGGGRLERLLSIAAILVVVAVMAAVTWGAGVPATGGVGAEDANLGAGSALVHDDAGNMPVTDAGSALVHDDAGNVAPAGAGSVVVHDDAGNVKPY